MPNIKYYGQQCQDDLINQKFRTLHTQIVNAIIQFCKENNILIDEFYLNADCLEDSIKNGSWQSCTDSCFELYQCKKTVDNKELETIKLDQKPFMISM